MSKQNPCSNQLRLVLLIALLIISIGVRLPNLLTRSITHDETVTLLETAGYATPSWPQKSQVVDKAQKQFEGTPSLTSITKDLRQTDVHPPVYYWILSLWRRWLGFSLETARSFSLLCSLGTILTLYLLLEIGKIQHPLVYTLIYAMSSASIRYGYEARAYALASLLVMMGSLFAYLAFKMSPRNNVQAAACSTAMAVCCGVAFQTNYLTLFPSCLILLWFLINLWSRSRFLAIICPLLAISIWLIGLPILQVQLGARPDQLEGFVGLPGEIKAILRMNIQIICYPIFEQSNLNFQLYGGLFVLLLGITIFRLKYHWSEVNKSFLLLLLGLALAPSIGIFLLDILFDKQLHSYKYVIHATPALAFIISYGISTLNWSKRIWGIFLLALLLSLQIVPIKSGFLRNPKYTENGVQYAENGMRSLAKIIKVSSLPSHVVAIAQGWGRGDIGALVYELNSQTAIVSFSPDSNLDNLESDVNKFDDIWVIYFSHPNNMIDVENAFLNRLQSSNLYNAIFHIETFSSPKAKAIHFRLKSQFR